VVMIRRRRGYSVSCEGRRIRVAVVVVRYQLRGRNIVVNDCTLTMRVGNETNCETRERTFKRGVSVQVADESFIQQA